MTPGSASTMLWVAVATVTACAIVLTMAASTVTWATVGVALLWFAASTALAAAATTLDDLDRSGR